MPELIGYPRDSIRSSAKLDETMARIRDLLDEGKNYRQQKRERIWRQSEEQYEGAHWKGGSDDPRADLVTVNMSFSTINTIVPYITGSAPSFLVQPYSMDANLRSAKAQEAFLNRLWNTQRVDGQRHLEDGAIDALIYGDGYVKVGYSMSEKRLDFSTFADVADLWVKRVSPWDLWIDPHANGIHDARWVAHRVRVARREIENDDRYKNTDEANLHPVEHTDDSDRRDVHPIQETGGHTDLVEVWDFYDLVDRTLYTIAQGNKPLRIVDDIGDCPIVQIPNYRIPGSPYHMGELEQLRPLQMELNKTRSELATHRRRNVAKYISRKGVLDSTAIDALQSAVVGDVAEVEFNGDLRDVIQPVQHAPLQNETYALSDQVARDIYEISGVNEYLRGATPSIRRTATEATIIEGASNVKTADKLRMVERAARRIGTLLLAFAADVFPETDYDEVGLYLTGRQAEQLNRADVQAQANDLAAGGDEDGANALLGDPSNIYTDTILRPGPDIWVGEYEVVVEQASTELRSPQMRAQKYRALLETAASIAPAVQVPINFKRLFEMWLEAEGVEDIDAIFDTQAAGPLGGLMAAAQGMPTAPGAPNPMAALPPEALIGAENSGTLAPQAPPDV